MFGNLLNNALIKKLSEQRMIQIDPFKEDNLQDAQYRLSPKAIIYEVEKDGEFERKIHDFNVHKDPFIFKAHDYAMIIPNESVKLQKGIVGRFIPESRLIEAGFGVFAGKLDPHYGEKSEQLIFSIVNLKSRDNEYHHGSPLVHVQFFDIRGLPILESKTTLQDLDLWKSRYAEKILAVVGGLDK